jgi:hypothetical protein
MTSKTAIQPQLSLAELIDQHLAISKQMENLVQEQKKLADQIAESMHGKKLNSAFGTGEEGYRLASWLQCDFKPEVLEYVRRIKKTEHFVPEPSVTKARLRDAFQNGHLTAVQFDRVKSFAGPDYQVNRLYKITKGAERV